MKKLPMKPAKRMQPFTIYYFAQLDQIIYKLRVDGMDIIRLDIGSPDLPPPQEVIDTLSHSAAKSDVHGYQPHLGPPQYRQAWADVYLQDFNVQLDPDHEIVPLLGSKEGIFHFAQAIIDPGDIFIIPDLHYPSHIRSCLFSQGQPYFAPLTPENHYLPQIEAIPTEIADKAKIMWLNYPNNPTGATATYSFYEKLVEWAENHQVLLCSDAAYNQVFFNGIKPPSVLQVPGGKEVAVEFNTLSKSHNMAGWRIAVLVGNPDALGFFLSLKSNIDSGQFRPMLEAATTALRIEPSWIEDRNRIYRERRDIVIEHFQKNGLHIDPPSAAIYIWVPIPSGQESTQFTQQILKETGVSLAPGTIFGGSGEGYTRISLVQPAAVIDEALSRITKYWK